MEKKLKKSLDELAEALSRSKDKELIRSFLESLLTPRELSEVASRWALVRMILEGNTQRNISRELGLSLCKITRGSKELKKEDSPFPPMIKLSKEKQGPKKEN